MKERYAAQKIQEALPLLRELISRLLNAQEFPFEYAGSNVELAEHIETILGGGRVPKYIVPDEKPGGAR